MRDPLPYIPPSVLSQATGDHGAREIWDKLGEVDRERLGDLIGGYDQRARFGWNGDRDGVAPIDCGGMNGSDHSYRFSKLARLGLAEHRKRGCDWGHAPKRRRGSKVYRPTDLGRAVFGARKP